MPCFPYRWIVFLDKGPDVDGRRLFELHHLHTYFPGNPLGERKLDVHSIIQKASPLPILKLMQFGTM